MSLDKPKVSIIVTVYKAEAYLRQCLESIVNQMLKEIEVVVVIDGSPDNSLAICEEFSMRDPRIKLLNQENQGAMQALQNGYNYSSGEYLMFVDGDDWIDLQTAEFAYNKAVELQLDLVFWSRVKESDNSSVAETSLFLGDTLFDENNISWLKRRVVGLLGTEIKAVTKTDAFSSIWGKLYRRQVIVDNQITSFDKNGLACFDVLFNVRAFNQLEKALYIKKFFSHYRLTNPASITKNHGLGLLNRYYALFDAIEVFIEDNKLDDTYSVALNNRIALSVINNVMSMTGVNTQATVSEKVDYLRTILNNPRYIDALRSFEFGYLPLHWKVFFLLGRWKLYFGVFLFSVLIRKLR